MTRFLRVSCTFIILLMPVRGMAGPGVLKDTAVWNDGMNAFAVAAPGGEILYAKDAKQMVVPASILKILTALVAFEHLGPEYRFHTDFHMDADNNLVIKGYGDPFLVSEKVAAIAGHLSGKLHTINNLVMDGSYFDPIVIPGTQAASTRSYDAPVSALCVNFNTVFFKTQKGEIVSAEAQTPLLPLARTRIQRLGTESGRIMLTSDGNETTRYAGELFQYFLNAAGVTINGDIVMAKADTKNLTRIYRYRSEIDVSEMVDQMMEYSNNFIANQLFLASGAKAYGAPATLEKGVRAAKTYAAGLGVTPEIVEGSGISRNNRMSAEMMITILDAFVPHYGLLQKRGRVYFKTGTLAGIQTRAGYIEGKNGVFYRFMAMLDTWDWPADPLIDRLANEL